MRPQARGARQHPGKGTIPTSRLQGCSSSVAFASILKPHKFGPAHRPLHPAWLGWGIHGFLAIGTPADPPVLPG